MEAKLLVGNADFSMREHAQTGFWQIRIDDKIVAILLLQTILHR